METTTALPIHLRDYKANAAGREAFLADLGVEITEALALEAEAQDVALLSLAGSIGAMADLGRTDRWKAACRWFSEEMLDNGNADRRWVILQGSIWLGYANLPA
jgi:hypothetical protein